MHFFTGVHIHGLAHAASGYHRVLEENRKLYNQVQDLKGKYSLIFCISSKYQACPCTESPNWLEIVIYFIWPGSIRVYCRVRPFLSGQSSYLSTVDHIEDGNITVSTTSKYGKGCKSFTFNKVFGQSATQGCFTKSLIASW